MSYGEFPKSTKFSDPMVILRKENAELQAEAAKLERENEKLKGTCICMDCGKIIKTVEQSKHNKECEKKSKFRRRAKMSKEKMSRPVDLDDPDEAKMAAILLRKEVDRLQVKLDDYKECYEDKQQLCREIDAIITDGKPAKQASLCDLVGPIRELKAKLDALRWIPVSEGLPEEQDHPESMGYSEMVLCYNKIGMSSRKMRYWVDCWNTKYKHWQLGESPTHWMPIPTLPDEEEDKDESV